MYSTGITSFIEISQLVIVTVTVPFYLFLLFLMVQAQFRKIDELATPFFKLCISTALIDLATLFANYFGVMFPKLGFFPSFYLYLDTFYAHTYFYIAWSTGICQAMSVSVLATNRLSAMIFPGIYHKMWLSHRLWIAVAVQLIPGMLIGSLTFFNTTELVLNEHDGIVPRFSNKQMTGVFFGVGGFFLLSNCLYLIVAYCYLFVTLKKSNQKVWKSLGPVKNRAKERRAKRREQRLFVMCSVIVAVQLTIFLFFTVKVAGVFQMDVDEFYLFYNALSDLFASINPYLLWIFSDSLRKYALSKIGICKSNSSTNTTIAVTKTIIQ